MRSQVRKFLRPLSPIASAALVLSGAAGLVTCIEWVPVLIGSLDSFAAPAAFAGTYAQPGAAHSVPRGIRASNAACSGCETTGSTRKVRMPEAGGGADRCAHRAIPAAVTSSRQGSVENTDLSILLDWHMTASNGYGLSHDRISCSTQAGLSAPLPIDEAEACEVLARFRDESGQASADTNPPNQHEGDPASVLPQATE